MNNQTRKKFCKVPAGHKAFALAELMISMVLIAVLATAISIALNQSHKRTGQTRRSFAELSRQKHCFQVIRDDLRLATNVAMVAPSGIMFDLPTGSGDDIETIVYHWDLNGRQLYRGRNLDDNEAIASNIYGFNLQADIFEQDSINYIRGITTTIQFGPDNSNTEQYYIEMINKPVLP